MNYVSKSLYSMCTCRMITEVICYSYDQTGSKNNTPVTMKVHVSASVNTTLKKSV